VAVARIAQMRRLARRHALAGLTQQQGGSLTNAQAAELGLESAELGAAAAANEETADYLKMTRISLAFSRGQLRGLLTLARRRDVSLAEVVREAVRRELDEALDRRTLYRRAARLIGAFDDRAKSRDLSRRHDAYFSQ